MPSASNSTVQRLRVEVVEPKPAPIPTRAEIVPPAILPEAPVEPAPAPTPPTPTRDRNDTMIAMFEALGYALSARFILFAALVGAFVLAVMAMGDPTPTRLWLLGIYNGLCVIPMVALEFVRRQR